MGPWWQLRAGDHCSQRPERPERGREREKGESCPAFGRRPRGGLRLGYLRNSKDIADEWERLSGALYPAHRG